MAVKVLVIDDEPDVAVIFRQKFRRRITAGDLEFSFAENGRAALVALQADPEISLVFTDIRMPGMDGLTFLKELRNLDRQLMLPVVVSAYDDMPNIREAMRQGAWDFVTKPIDLDDLERVLNGAVTEIEQKQEAIRNAGRLAHAEQERLLAIRSKEYQQEFFENITHELRTPLTLLLAPLEMAATLSKEPEVQGHLGQAQRGGRILQDLVNQLLDFAKAESGRLLPDWRSVQLSRLTEQIADLFQHLAESNEVELHRQIANDLRVRMDPRMYARILINLLSNAFKFTPKGGRIDLKLAAMNGIVALEVADSGPGFQQSETNDAFQRFQVSWPGHHQSQPGTGLGLSICKSLSEAMGGKISVESATGEGAHFRVELPVGNAAEVDLEELETDWINWVSFSAGQPVGVSGADDEDERPTILVVEDHPDMRGFIAQLLSKEYQVSTAENGRAALDLAEEMIPDLIVTDWMMPELDGLELLRQIRLRRDTHHIPVVMLTAMGDIGHRIEGIQTGAESFLAKPFHPDELLAVIRNQLAHRDRMRDHFRTELLHPDRVSSTSMEDQFLSELKKVMEKNLMNEQFGVETMADSLAMSRRTLVRKLHAVTGQAPVKFIRAYRLERSMQMLKDNAAPIWEIAVKTGFGSASYFTKCFKDHYGISPKEAQH
ncbi:MAG: response regulator [Bacteroidia bacterium]